MAEGAFKNNKKVQTVTIGKNAFKGVKKNSKITVQAKNKTQYNKTVKLIKKSGTKNVKFAYKKKK